MDQVFLLVLIGGTSAAALVVGARALGLPARRLGSGVRRALELAGLCVLFLGANLAVGLGVILAVRRFTGYFLSVYLLNDIGLVALSALQAVVFECWRREGHSQ
ncbi:MAG: hypothetical protein ACRELW_15850 [Candidatus Rokuibacteriota bacterium]